MHHMAAQWIPPNERSKFVSAYLGGSVGIALFYPFFGYIISIICWEWVFYLSAVFGGIWYVGWLYLVYDTPAQHPRIAADERIYIETSLGNTVHSDKTVGFYQIKLNNIKNLDAILLLLLFLLLKI